MLGLARRMAVGDGGGAFSGEVNALVIAGAPIDTDAGDAPIKHMAQAVADEVLRGPGHSRWGIDEGQVHAPGMEEHHPDEHYIKEHIDLYEHIDYPAYLAKRVLSRDGTRTPSTCRGAGIFR